VPAAPPDARVLPVTALFGTSARARGSAVVLPQGRLLTAAHVVDEASVREALCRRGRWPAEEAPYLTGLGAGVTPAPATRERIGQSSFRARGCDLAYRNGADLALLRIEGAAAVELLPLGASICPAEPADGTTVVVATRQRRFLTRLDGAADERDPANGRYAVLPDRLEEGESGGGVFDAASGCLLGIISQRDPERPDRTWIVRAAVIREFLAQDGGP
jgi:hypothetical protein